MRISSLSWLAWARMRPKGSAMKLPPQNSMPEWGVWSPGPWSSTVAGLPSAAVALNLTSPCSWPTRLTAADEDSVGDGVGALGGLPGFVLGGAELLFFGGVPADGGGEEEDLGSAEGGEAGAFGVPLVPADEGADGAGGGAGWP